MNQEKIKISPNGECSHHMNFQCHEIIIPNSAVCIACINAQKENHAAKADIVISHIESGKTITKRQCDRNFNYLNLGDIIYKIRKNHSPDYIITEMKANPVTGSRFAVYSKNPKYIKESKSDGK